MSLILDALRKSEAERRRGQAPDLHSPSPLLARMSPPRRSPWPIVLVIVGLITLAAVSWFYLSPIAAPDAARPVPAPAANTDAIEPPADFGRIRANALPATTATPTSPVATIPAPAQAPVGPREKPTALTTEVQPAAVAPPVATPAPAPPTAADTDEPGLLPVSALSPTQRSAMPPLKMSMHVWAEKPGERFAIIDGQRVGEGAQLPGAVVAGIRRDGVVLDVDGRLYLLPRP